MIKKILITSALVASVSANACAETSDYAPQVTLGGYLDTQAGYVNQKHDFRYSDPQNIQSPKLSNHAIVNDTKLWLKVDGQADAGFKYGGMIKLYADTSDAKEEALSGGANNQAEQTMAYIEGMFGRIEAGNYVGVSDTMKVDAATFASATGGVDGDAKYWWNNDSVENYNAAVNNVDAVRYLFLESPNLPTNDIGTVGIRAKNAAKISYYTPSYSGFMAGITYTPDMQVHGTIAEAKAVTSSIGAAQAIYDSGLPVYKNIFEGGLYYENMFDQLGVKASVTGEAGKAKKRNNGTTVTRVNRNLRAWQAGLNLSYMGFTVGGSYGSWGKSMLNIVSQAKSTKYWTVGAGYEYGPFSSSLTYLDSKRGVQSFYNKRDHTRLVSLGVDYKLAPGLMPYAEVNWFNNSDKNINPATNTAYPSNKGTVFLLGSKLQF